MNNRCLARIKYKKKAIFQAWMIEQSRTIEISLQRKIIKEKGKRLREKKILFFQQLNCSLLYERREKMYKRLLKKKIAMKINSVPVKKNMKNKMKLFSPLRQIFRISFSFFFIHFLWPKFYWNLIKYVIRHVQIDSV